MNALVKLILFKLIPYDLCFPKPTRMGGVGDVESDVPEPEAAPVSPAGVAPPPTLALHMHQMLQSSLTKRAN